MHACSLSLLDLQAPPIFVCLLMNAVIVVFLLFVVLSKIETIRGEDQFCNIIMADQPDDKTESCNDHHQKEEEKKEEELTSTSTISTTDNKQIQEQATATTSEPTSPVKTEPIDSKSKTNSETKSDTKKMTKEKVMSKEEYIFPTNLEDFGYHFTNDGRLRSIETDEPFQFEVRKDDKTYNQKRYDALGEVITPHIYQLLETETHLIKHFIPVDPKEREPTSFFFASKDAFTNPDKLMVIIHGSGVVRAGQWARRLIINDCLKSGTQLPFIERALKEGYGVVVLNGNRNYEDDNKEKQLIRGSSTPEEHGIYVWEHFITKAPAKKVHIIAHSHGGVVTVEIMKQFLDDFRNRVDKIAFTDSVHMLDAQHVSVPAKRYISNVAINWVSSKDPLDTPQHHIRNTVQRVSAGTNKHVETSWFSFNSVFKFLQTPPNSL